MSIKNDEIGRNVLNMNEWALARVEHIVLQKQKLSFSKLSFS